MIGIRLSEKYGVNPSLMQCFVCMKEIGVVLFGHLPEDREAPRKACIDHEPCNECKGWMAQGVVLISIDEARSKTDTGNPYRTGSWCVVKDDALRRMIPTPELCENILKRRLAFVPDETWDALGLPRRDTNNRNAKED